MSLADLKPDQHSVPEVHRDKAADGYGLSGHKRLDEAIFTAYA